MHASKRGIAAIAAMIASLATPALAQDSTLVGSEAPPEAPPTEQAQPTAPVATPAPEARPTQAMPRQREETGFTLGLRLGFGLPSGNAAMNAGDGSALPMTDYIGSSIPLWVEPGYRLSRAVILGGYLQYALGNGTAVAGRSCKDMGVSCSSHLLRIGVEVLYRLSPDSSLSPWFGLGTGYERLTVHGSDATQAADVWLSGWEIVNLQLGFDRVVSDRFAIGPFATASIGQYGTVGVSSATGDGSTDVARTAMHLWFTFGAKGTFDF